MHEKADHPHQAAVHLVKSIKCCKQCYDVTERDYAELGQLQFQKDQLARELSKYQNLAEDKARVAAEIEDLNFLIMKVKEQNRVAYEEGLNHLDKLTVDREMFEKNHRQSFHQQIKIEKQRSKTMAIEIDQLTQKIRYLHRINEELVNKFCRY